MRLETKTKHRKGGVEDDPEDQEIEQQIQHMTIPNLVAIADNNSKLQSQLTTVERFVTNADFTSHLYAYETPEAQALQAMIFSGVTSTATLPVLVRPTTEAYMTESDMFVDRVRMQANLPLLDADMATAECVKCNKAVTWLGYHAAFFPSTCTYIHDAVVNELRDCLRSMRALGTGKCAPTRRQVGPKCTTARGGF